MTEMRSVRHSEEYKKYLDKQMLWEEFYWLAMNPMLRASEYIVVCSLKIVCTCVCVCVTIVTELGEGVARGGAIQAGQYGCMGV